ncbi:MAG TPA: single-stranded DNA-binding protein [Jatrophihabitans sp.]|jgi:single-strand DNA-binding protein
MNEVMMTLVGNVVDDPTVRVTGGGHKVANFRMASTPRRFDREQGRWVDGITFFVTVTAWRNLADGVEASIQKGQPVIVMGRYQTRTYEVGETTRVAHELEAISVGHDLNRGSTEFRKRARPSSSNEVELDEDGVPADVSAGWIDPQTGEVFEPVDEIASLAVVG